MKKTTQLTGGLTLLVCLIFSTLSFAQSQTFTTTGTFQVPAGVTSIQVEAWGAGGAGGGATGNPSAGGGGAGGGYVKNTALTVIPGTLYTVTVGTGGIGNTTSTGPDGGDSWFGSTATLLAVGGNGGNRSTTNSNTASGGTAQTSGNVGWSGSFNYYGGAGGTGAAAGASGGAGGSSAGTGSNGNPGLITVAGSAVTGGGAGVNGSTTSADGNDNNNLGGGGAGGRAGTTTDRSGGNGGPGRIIITWTCPTYALTSTSTATAICTNTAATVTLNGSVANLPAGIYTVTYNLSGANTATGSTATMTIVVAGMGTFNTSNLTNAGSTTITVTNLSSGGTAPNNCSSNISTNNTANFTVTGAASQPSIITGNTTPCIGTSLVYSVTNTAGVSYAWSFPSGWTQTGGGTTNSVTVTVGSGSGNISVQPSNLCGNGTARTLAVAPIAIPSQPSAITGSTGPCIGGSVNYSVTNVAGVTYNWNFPSGWIQTAGGTTNSVTVTVTGTAGNISVMPSNSCGNGTAQTLAVTPVSGPAQPSTITGPISACQGSSVNYSVALVAGVSYNWTFPTGWTQTAGTTTNSITVTVGSGSGNITVTPTMACGNGTPRTLAVTPSPTPTITSTTPGSRTGAGSVNLAATSSIGTISWFAAATGGAALGTGNSFATPDITSSTTFYIEATSAGCTSAPRVGVLATVNAPEIAVSGNGFNIADEDTTPDVSDFTNLGTSNVSIPLTRSYTIQNIGNLPLNIGTFTIAGVNMADFVLVTTPAATLAAGASTTFSIRFTPSAVGVRNATVSFVTNDADENPFNFYIRGTGGTGVNPEIRLEGNGQVIEDGDSGATTADWTDFGNVTIGNNLVRTFTIRNTGTGPLTLTDNPNYVVLTGSPYFTIISQPSGTIAAGGTTTFQVRFTPSATGNAVAIISIANDDSDESIYDFTIVGTGVITGRDIGIMGNEVLIEDGASTVNIYDQTDFGITDLSTPIAIPFNVHSFGSSTLTVSSTAITAGQGFTITPLNANVTSSSPNSFVVTFTPTAVGVRTATVTVTSNANNPSSKATYTFIVRAEVQNLPALTTAPGGVTSNLKFWLKANSNVGSVADNQSLNVWTDQTTGSTKNSIAKFSKEPKFKNNAADNINFNPVIYFNGSNTMSGSQGFNHQDMFVVIRPSNDVTWATSPQDIYCGDDIATNKNSQDVTGFEMGNTSARYGATAADVVAFNQGANTSYGVAEISTSKVYSGVNIFNPRRSPANRMMLVCNGNTLATTEFLTNPVPPNNYTPYKDIVNSRYWLGRSEYFDASYDGDIVEIINYSSLLTTIDRSKVESYLAIKYGITLGVNGVSQDYVDSAGITLFPSSNGFNYNIAGIGRDDNSGLNQKQSKTENTSNDVTMGLGTIEVKNSDNANTFDTDKSYLIWGSNNGTLGAQSPILVNMSSGISGLTTEVDFTAIGRTWKVIETGGDVKTVTVSVPSTLLTSTITPPGDFLMFISSSPIFSPTAEYRIMRVNGSKLETTYDFNGTTYITFGYAPERTFERSIAFDGVDDYLDAGDVLDLHNTNFTVSAWVKRNNVNQTILSKRNNAFSAGYDLKINAQGKAEMSWMNGTRQTITSSVEIPLSIWHNIAVTFDGTTAMMYIDGILDTTENLLPVLDTNQSFIIAAADGTNTTSFFDGTIDEVRVWGQALTAVQLRYVMNQELVKHSDSTVNGSIIPQVSPSNEVASIPWSSVRAYYPMSTYTYTNAKDRSDNDYTAALKNLITVDYQTAPVPYISTANGDFDNISTWANSATQELPYATSIVDPTKKIAWNIVRTTHAITSESNKVVLGWQVNSNTVTANNNTKIEVSHYLKLDGKIDLQGRSQLIQTLNSYLDPTSAGFIERDQQGTKNLYNYNYWCSPVGGINNTTNNSSFSLINVMKDGTNPEDIKPIAWMPGYYGFTNPTTIGIANNWIYKFQNLSNSYANWTFIGALGTLNAGEGFTMKGPGASTATQNYAFSGKPNNGLISIPIAATNLNLTGNPYPSALDSQRFIQDNLGVLDGTLYFWEHAPSNASHNSAQYEGGYSALNLVGGTPPVAPPAISGLGNSSRVPNRFIPVGQGFFVTGNSTGGNIIFNNNQRLFVKEDNAASNTMFRNAHGNVTHTSPEDVGGSDNDNSNDVPVDEMAFSKIRLGFISPNNHQRQILMGFMNEYATSSLDAGFDALLFDDFPSDMYFINGEAKLVIQGEGFFNEASQYKLGVKTSEEGLVKFALDELINFDDQQVYIYDSVTETYHNINQEMFSIQLPAGLYENRFYVTFTNVTLGTGDQLLNAYDVTFTNNDNSINITNKNLEVTTKTVSLFNIIGQNIQTWDVENQSQQSIKIPVKKYSAGTYIVKLITSTGTVSKKIIIK